MSPSWKSLAAAICLAAVTLNTGCANKEAAKTEELQKELEETKKKLAEATGSTAGQSSPSASSAPAASPATPQAALPRERPSQPRTTSAPVDSARPAPVAPRTYTVPAGTRIVVRTIDTISTKTATEGSTFEASLAEPLVVDGNTLAPRGASVTGVVTNADPGGRVKGVASLSVALRSVALGGGRSLALNTQPVGVQAKKTVAKDAAKVGIGAGVGAAIGAIAGGGKGAGIGAAIGGGSGAGVALGTRGDPAVIPSESLLTFTTRSAARVE
jgi:hypothetical protein